MAADEAGAAGDDGDRLARSCAPSSSFSVPDVEVAVIVKLSGSLPALNARAQIAHRILDRALGLEAEHALDLVGVDVIGARIVGGRRDDRDRRPSPETPPATTRFTISAMSMIDMVLIAGVEDLAGDLLVRHRRAAARTGRPCPAMCRLGRSCAPPKTVILPLLTAWLVRMLTDRSRRMRGAVAADRGRADGHAGEARATGA